MSFPTVHDELALHERALNADPLAPVDLFEAFTDPLIAVVQCDLWCDDDLARDAVIDATFEYLGNPSAYKSHLGRLCTFLARIAKRRAIDSIRSRSAEAKREQEFGKLVELWASAPNGEVESSLDAEILWLQIERNLPDARDRAALKLILDGERSTEALAEALGIQEASELERQRQVKRHRDRLVKVLTRLGARMRDEEGT